jgi:hypothetical protein
VVGFPGAAGFAFFTGFAAFDDLAARPVFTFAIAHRS